jgi:hypothetical protein
MSAVHRQGRTALCSVVPPCFAVALREESTRRPRSPVTPGRGRSSRSLAPGPSPGGKTTLAVAIRGGRKPSHWTRSTGGWRVDFGGEKRRVASSRGFLGFRPAYLSRRCATLWLSPVIVRYAPRPRQGARPAAPLLRSHTSFTPRGRCGAKRGGRPAGHQSPPRQRHVAEATRRQPAPVAAAHRRARDPRATRARPRPTLPPHLAPRRQRRVASSGGVPAGHAALKRLRAAAALVWHSAREPAAPRRAPRPPTRRLVPHAAAMQRNHGRGAAAPAVRSARRMCRLDAQDAPDGGRRDDRRPRRRKMSTWKTSRHVLQIRTYVLTIHGYAARV